MNPGDVFEGRYRIIRELGAGGFATVFLAEHVQIEQRVAIKVLLEPGSDPRFLREGKILAKLSSPNTVRILDFGESSSGHPYMISEFVEGETLEQLAARHPLSADEVIPIVEQILESLAEAHEQGIIHRDIKPANIMRLPDGHVKVLDFGIARVSQTVDVEGLTGSGIVIGTPRYLAPECLLSPESITPAADIFAVGLVVYVLLTGRPANDGLSSRQIVARHLSMEPYVLPMDIDAPPKLRDWVVVATRKIAQQRYQNAREALAALRADAVPDETGAAPALIEDAGTREIELDLGDGELLEVGLAARPAPATSDTAAQRAAARPRGRPAEPSRWPAAIGIVVVIAVLAGGIAVATGKLRMDAARSLPGSWFQSSEPISHEVQVPDPQPVADLYAEGKRQFDDQQWIESLRHFHELSTAYPDTNAARDLELRGYSGRAIANVLEDAIDAREAARNRRERDAAAEGPRQILELYPDHEATREVLLSIADAVPGKTKRRRQPKIQIQGVQ